MKYLCLVYMEERTLADIPDRECMAYGDSLRQSGRYVAAEALQRVEMRPRSGCATARSR